MNPSKPRTPQDREVRYSTSAIRAVEQRRDGETGGTDDGYFHIEGEPIVFGRETVLYQKELTGLDYDIREVLEPGCLDGADMSDVVLNVNHGEGNYGIARTRNGTLRLTIGADGVRMEADLKKTNPRCAQVYEDISEGLLDKMSFRFNIGEEEYDEESNTFHVRRIASVKDVSLVEFPAYDTTSVSAKRSRTLDGIRERAVALDAAERTRAEIREKIAKAFGLEGGKEKNQ